MLDDKQRKHYSKFMSLVLRHRPEKLSLDLDRHGWADIETLINEMTWFGKPITRAELDEVVAKCPKQRFAISEDGTRIRASQGHSIDVNLDYEPRIPPELLYHGTVEKYLHGIIKEGLRKMRRHHVHLSDNVQTATEVGRRRGPPVLLLVFAGDHHRDGQEYYLSANGVWLTKHVPVQYIEFPEEL